MLKKIPLVFLFLIIGLVTLFFSFWLSLPEKRVVHWTKKMAYEISPMLEVEIIRPKTTFLGLEIEEVVIKLEAENLELVRLRGIELSLFQPKLFTGKFDLEAGFYLGEIVAEFNLLKNSATGSVDNASINRNPFLRRTGLIDSSPSLKANFMLDLNRKRASANFSTSGLALSGKAELVRQYHDLLPEVTTLSNVSGMFELEGGELNATVKTEGDFNGSLTGSLALFYDSLPESVLNFRLAGKIREGFLDAYPVFKSIIATRFQNSSVDVTLTGNLSNPQISGF